MYRMLCLFIVFGISIHNYAQQTMTNVLSLNQALENADKHHPELRIARYSKEISSLQKGLWLGLPAPVISFAKDYIPGGMSISNSSESSFGVTQQVEFPTNYFLKKSKLNIEDSIAALAIQATGIKLHAEVKTSYYKLDAINEELILAKENLQLTKDFLEKAVTRFEAGECSKLEVLSAQLQYKQASSQITMIESQKRAALSALKYSMGLNPIDSTEIELSDQLKIPEFIPLMVSNLHVQLSPAYQIEALQLPNSQVLLKQAWSSLLPNIELGYAHQSREGISNFYGVSVGISLPLWFATDSRIRIQTAEISTSISEENLRLTENSLMTKLKAAHEQLQNDARQVLQYKTDLIPQTDTLYQAALASYNLGEATYIELLQSKQSFIEIKKNFINVVLSYNLSLVAVEAIIGTFSE